MRTRLIYSKRGGACFVPHVALSAIFARAALRANLKLSMTQGFSPRAKISFAPELPAGVIALNEPVEIFFDETVPDNVIEILNNAMPEGFIMKNILFPDENSISLGKICSSALYLIKSKFINAHDLDALLREHYKNEIFKSDFDSDLDNDWLMLYIKNPAQNGIGSFVKKIISQNIINGWHQINIVRHSIGLWNGKDICLS